MFLPQKVIIHNSGQDLWDFMFEHGQLKYYEVDEEKPESNWFDEGMDWFKSSLLENEQWDFFETEGYVYTSFCRVANIKAKRWLKLQLQASSFLSVVDKKNYTMNKVVREKWGLDWRYDTLPEEAKVYVNTSAYEMKLKRKRDGTKAR